MGIAGRNAAILFALLCAGQPLNGGTPDTQSARAGVLGSFVADPNSVRGGLVEGAVPDAPVRLRARDAQTPSLEEVLARIARYVTDFNAKLAGIVAEEHYRQEIKHTATHTLLTFTALSAPTETSATSAK